MRSRVPKAYKRVREIPVPAVRFHKRTKLHNCNIYAEHLVQSHAGTLAVYSVSGSSWEPR